MQEQEIKIILELSEELQFLRKRTNLMQTRILAEDSSLLDMLLCFRCLTTEGGWHTMDKDMQEKMLAYRDNARKVLTANDY